MNPTTENLEQTSETAPFDCQLLPSNKPFRPTEGTCVVIRGYLRNEYARVRRVTPTQLTTEDGRRFVLASRRQYGRTGSSFLTGTIDRLPMGEAEIELADLAMEAANRRRLSDMSARLTSNNARLITITA